MAWTVVFTGKARKEVAALPKNVAASLAALILDIEATGPVRGDWPNYSKLSGHTHHCHIKKGQPTYVAVWREDKAHIRLVEIVYAGTHEKAPY